MATELEKHMNYFRRLFQFVDYNYGNITMAIDEMIVELDKTTEVNRDEKNNLIFRINKIANDIHQIDFYSRQVLLDMILTEKIYPDLLKQMNHEIELFNGEAKYISNFYSVHDKLANRITALIPSQGGEIEKKKDEGINWKNVFITVGAGVAVGVITMLITRSFSKK